MKIIYKQGNLLDCAERWILHGVNMQGKMASGVAKDIRTRYPSAYDVYMYAYSVNALKLGVVTFADVGGGKKVFNGVTQEFYGKDGKQYVDYWAVKEVIQAMNYYATCGDDYFTREGMCIAMPKIGAGLGGGDWDIISKIIEEESVNFQPVVYTL